MQFSLNGSSYDVAVEPGESLADVVRQQGFTGTHLGCEEGVCGSCTVLVNGKPVRSCLMLAQQVEGYEVRTIECATHEDPLRVIQEAFCEYSALQCGFCTPGFIMLLVGLFEAEPNATTERIKSVLSSNLCRCTGYKPIIDAALHAQKKWVERAK